MLPRIAFNLDKGFARCNACGKQALTMCMGFGCNAAGVVGCRIISGKRERLIAILTNSFVPCNGRFPMLIALISLFLAGHGGGSAAGSLTAAGVLALVVVFSAAATLAVSFILSKTLLRGESSAFTLELPPYRVPRIGQVIVRSVLDRTLHVLGRAAAVAAPWGLAVYALANISAGGETLLSWFCSWLDPAARLIGLEASGSRTESTATRPAGWGCSRTCAGCRGRGPPDTPRSTNWPHRPGRAGRRAPRRRIRR